MTHIPGFDRSQLLLLPEAIDDYVSVDNPVRFINAFVDGLDLKAAGFERVEAKATGRPGYAPGDLLKLYIYGYLNRVRSSRRLEAECHRNIEIIWLLGGLKPDFKTIADFRSDNRAAFKKVFRQFVILCRRLDLFGRELLAVDGTRIKAVNNKDRNFTTGSLQKFIEAADKKLEDYLKRLDAGDAEERATGGSRVENLTEKIEALRKKRSEYAAHRSALEKNGESQVSLTDPDSRAMAAHTKVGVGYNIQVAVDAKHKMIVEQEVTNQVLEASEGHSGAGAGNSRGRKNRCGRRQGLFQDRRHRGLRGSRPDAVSAAPATRGGGEERLFPQGRVPLRRETERLHLSGRPGADAAKANCAN